ncbi:hypothetical protein CMV30_01720 [Nibricoccus aquaticus]|uniref:Porin n=1 Tax=Nibricoccus aquaticus TaxID=2576891 RepID=A0A290Q963_9BACT|nr:hypothetical protein [Nibricoccus aquaticus]ATC62786.1 hypothetical protein CMV30_01720 [Nibricoccus aquaticus]
MPRLVLHRSFTRLVSAACLLAAATSGEAAVSVEDQLRELAEQNRQLMEQLKTQQKTIDELRTRMDAADGVSARRETQLLEIKEQVAENAGSPAASAVRSEGGGQKVILSGVAGLAFFDSGSQGQFPNAEFRVDEAKLFLEAPVWTDTYFLAEIDLTLREQDTIALGEVYMDFERAGRAFGLGRELNVRVGRINLPFGEEYLVRDAINNPLISHSLADVWGVDEGVALYGEKGKWSYVLAVQNGGRALARDFDKDKSVTARVSYDPLAWLHVSASALRTGDLSVAGDGISEVWFADGVFVPIGGPTTTVFSGKLYELNATGRWKSGHLNVALGRGEYSDDDRAADNSRRMSYGSVELMQTFVDGFFGAARYSWIDAKKGYPLSGHGDRGRYLFSGALTDELRRLGLGVGYRFGEPLVIKAEYMMEDGSLLNGTKRDNEDLFAAEIGLKF